MVSYLSFSMWLTSLSMIISASTIIYANGIISFFFMQGQNLNGELLDSQTSSMETIYVLWILVSSLLKAFRLLYSAIFREESLTRWKGDFRYHQTIRGEGKEKLQSDTEITEWESPSPWDARQVLQPWFQFCQALEELASDYYHSQGHIRLIHHSVFDLKLTSPKIYILFTWNKELQYEALTHQKHLYATWKFLKIFSSNMFSGASAKHAGFWSESKSTFTCSRIAAKTIFV